MVKGNSRSQDCLRPMGLSSWMRRTRLVHSTALDRIKSSYLKTQAQVIRKIVFPNLMATSEVPYNTRFVYLRFLRHPNVHLNSK